jgi:hypothetical protein
MIKSVEIFLTKNPRVVIRQEGKPDVVVKQSSFVDVPAAMKKVKRETAAARVKAAIESLTKKLSKYVKDNVKNENVAHLVGEAKMERERLSKLSDKEKSEMIDAETNRLATAMAIEEAGAKFQKLLDTLNVDALSIYL